MKIVNFLEKSELLIKVVNNTIQNKEKEQKSEFFSMLLGTLGASLLTPFHPGFLIPVFSRGGSKLQPPAINPAWLMLLSCSACRPSKMGSPGI